MVDMDIISELKEYIGNNPLFYLKFCRCLEYANDILNGNLYSNNVKYFRELEEKEHEHGQGDLHEVALLAKSENITLYDNTILPKFFTKKIIILIRKCKFKFCKMLIIGFNFQII